MPRRYQLINRHDGNMLHDVRSNWNKSWNISQKPYKISYILIHKICTSRKKLILHYVLYHIETVVLIKLLPSLDIWQVLLQAQKSWHVYLDVINLQPAESDWKLGLSRLYSHMYAPCIPEPRKAVSNI